MPLRVFVSLLMVADVGVTPLNDRQMDATDLKTTSPCRLKLCVGDVNSFQDVCNLIISFCPSVTQTLSYNRSLRGNSLEVARRVSPGRTSYHDEQVGVGSRENRNVHRDAQGERFVQTDPEVSLSAQQQQDEHADVHEADTSCRGERFLIMIPGC